MKSQEKLENKFVEQFTREKKGKNIGRCSIITAIIFFLLGLILCISSLSNEFSISNIDPHYLEVIFGITIIMLGFVLLKLGLVLTFPKENQ